MSQKNRDWRYELLRIFAMFLIVLAHFFSDDNWAVHTDSNRFNSWGFAFHSALIMLGQVGVTLFVLISAYFLAQSKSNPIPRAIRLWIQLFIYSAGILLSYTFAYSLIKHSRPPISLRDILSSLLPITMGTYWFITAFFFMILFGPFLNILFDNLSSKGQLLFVCLTLWTTFIVRLLNPSLQYFTDIAYLISIYAIGSYIRRNSNSLPRIELWKAALITFGCFIVCAAGTYLIQNSAGLRNTMGLPSNLLTAGPGASPILAVIAGSLIFIWVSQTKAASKSTTCGSIILAIAPATFGVYLIHENFLIKGHLWNFIFIHPEPPSMIAKIVFSLVSIIVLYITLLIVSLIVHQLVIKPVTSLVDNHVIARINFHPASHLSETAEQ
ncbi:Acyltransferase family protein [Bifidobacterium bohemicum]|uniref:Proline symporter n=1 Tax=Bifidobacterium bohemicum DSM 22767 TaxID=1437606 RepID=A0A086ZHP8_9BIFI|nr:acyltransferase [Bifidobacterium bohemicum]KFI46048.1 proline symporter [Bifidobacterium bohemicum DSM 22767]SCC05635.1 Acyltransferase family protein [Bifidobacterium bohemicum]